MNHALMDYIRETGDLLCTRMPKLALLCAQPGDASVEARKLDSTLYAVAMHRYRHSVSAEQRQELARQHLHAEARTLSVLASRPRPN